MISSKEFINISSKVFPDIVNIDTYTDYPIGFKELFNVFIIKRSGEEVLVICFDKMSSISSLTQFLNYLKKSHTVYIYLSSDFMMHDPNSFSLIYRHRFPFIDYFGRIYNDDGVTNSFKDIVSDLCDEAQLTYTKFTQLVYKYYLFHHQGSFTVRTIADDLKISPSSVSRANETLCHLGVLTTSGVGAGKEYSLINKKASLKILKDYFLLPYNKTYYLLLDEDGFNKISNYPLSLDDALSEYTELLKSTNTKTYAVWKKEFNDFYQTYTSKIYSNSAHYVAVQSFIYDPKLFSLDGKVIDLLDIYIIMLKKENLKDPRMNDAFKEIERRLINID